jgi:hypothetical protein
MYSTCIFCHRSLGANQVVEAFPVGRRLAFDPHKGRLWVVCRACRRWNLSPAEERWEALEECERLFRETRLRVATENIGLANLAEGTELIRVGKPLRPELAAWRYAGQFGRRRLRAAAGAGVGALVATGIATGSVALTGGVAALGGFASLGWHLYNLASLKLRPPAPIRTPDGETIEIDPARLAQVRIRPNDDADGGWELMIQRAPQDVLTLQGSHAEHAAAVLLPRINRTGASRKEVATAVKELEGVRDPLEYFTHAEYRARKKGYGYNPIATMPKPIRLALEMAAHEESERRAIQGELILLEQAWKDAEEIAAIADSLAVPARIEALLAKVRGTASGP